MKVASISSSLMKVLFLALLLSTCVVNSQTDSCSSNLKLNNILFDTTSLHCASVWDSEGFILRYGQSSSNASLWNFVLSAQNPNTYVAIGFSKNGRMEGSSAVVGWVSKDGVSHIKRYYLGGKLTSRVEVDQGNLTLVGSTGSILSQSSRLYMAFQLVVDGTGDGKPESHVLYAVGPDGFYPVEPNLRLMEHRSKHSTFLDYASGTSNSKGSPHLTLRRSHGIFNILAWSNLMIVGVMMARYYRHKDPLWFYLHVGIQSFALLMGITGVLCGFLLENRLGVNVSTHKGLGIFIFVLGLLQAMALLARPNKTAKNRKYWNWYHYTVGRTLLAFAIANIFYGIKLGGEGGSWIAGYVVSLLILIITCAVLEYRMWTTDNLG